MNDPSGFFRPRPGWSNLMPTLTFPPLPPLEVLLPVSSLLSSPPQAVAVRARTRAAAEAAVTLRSFMRNFL